jgi:hypothetical protein
MRLLDIFRRPDRVRNKKVEMGDTEALPLPEKIEPAAMTTGKAAQQSLPNRASEEDAA